MKRELGQLTLLGAGGHGRVTADIASQLGYRLIAFVDSQYPVQQKTLIWPIIGRGIDDIPARSPAFVSVGDCAARYRLLTELMALQFTIPTLIHPSASVSALAEIGWGSVVMPLAVINAGAKIGFGAIINSGATVDHDCILGDGVHISPGAHLAGGVSVGNTSWVGIGSNIREMIKIGAKVMVGAGSVVVNDIQDNQTVMGVPARARRRLT